VRLNSDRHSYSLRDNIRLEVVRKNTGRASVFVYRRWEWGISKIRVFDISGKEVEDVMYAVDDPPPLSASDFILLHPGERIRTRVDRQISDLVKRPGDHELIVEYTPYLTDSLAHQYTKRSDIPFWSKLRGTVTSNRIKLHVAGIPLS
jgi:hypothetical protein